jgi:hypothetical protein
LAETLLKVDRNIEFHGVENREGGLFGQWVQNDQAASGPQRSVLYSMQAEASFIHAFHHLATVAAN